ncbi:MAG: cob(I)yrinic acid a,c-diamide adenosyltransferase [Solirubrobacterales bacterium]
MSEVKIYTRKGDDGTTGLWYGGRVAKNDLHTSAYGDVDEAISVIAVARADSKEAFPTLSADLLEMQRCMFIGCAQLATAPESFAKLEAGVTLVEPEMVDALEARIDWYKERLDLPPKFIIPGGTRLSAELDVARTVVRRAERSVVSLHQAEPLPDTNVLRYLNRASDLLFAMARYADEPSPTVFEGRGK